jgi:trk system potassium uptake protein TrkA
LIVKDSPGSQVKQVIARATSDLHMKMLQRVGADRVVFPSKMQGHRLGMELVRPNLLERLRLDDRNSIEEIRVPQAFIGQSLREINLRKNYNVSVLAAGPDNQLTVNPPASHVLQAGELLVVMGASEALAKLPGS